MFECLACKYSCQYKSKYEKHLKTKKHLDAVNSGALCSGCGKHLSSNFSKNRHEKTCKTYQTMNQTINMNTNITNNIENQTNIILNGVNNAESFVITIEDLIKKNLTTALQKVILADMLETDFGIMDLIDKFDKLIEEEVNKQIYEHNHYCDVTKRVIQLTETGEEEIVEEEWTPLTHPEYNWNCRHVRNNFNISNDKLSDLLVNTFLDSNSNPVVTHANRLCDDNKLLYKHLKTLHSDQILLKFLSKSKKKEHFKIDDDYRPSLELKKIRK